MENKPLLQIDRAKIRKHWGKTDSEVEECISNLKKWIKTQDFPEMPTDHMIEVFLTNCKYKMDQTKINIQCFYSIRQTIPEVYDDSNPKLPEMKEAWKMGGYLPLPKLTPDLYRICMLRINSETKGFNATRYFANAMNIYEVKVCEDLVLGEICIMDYSELQWSHLLYFSPFLLRKMIFIMENVAKSRVKQIHVIRTPSYVNILINIAKKFMKKKMADRIQIHKSIEELYKYVPQELMPADYGGKQPSINEMIGNLIDLFFNTK
ncbi:unnamed protein product [Phyllotreta striolata]|uniref:CRAL-TRIO domain-containing protein n=1 Tax=Phyllotreta striolata TaxID=444603 RepID=A0A9N9XM98_PHYSR|nr:unnamed protein product [Phyllotreta striolata]